jgi:hypothetical protein
MAIKNLLEEDENESTKKIVVFEEETLQNLSYIQIMCSIFILTCYDILS